jgi:NADH-quinone oxidoreductase subunit E
MTKKLGNIIKKYAERKGNIIFLLQETQEVFGYIPREAVEYFSEELDIAPSRFYGVATFYSQFRLAPSGRNKITACCGTACHVKGAERIFDKLKKELGLSSDEDTTGDREFTLEKVACLGTCSFAPIVLINGSVRGKANPNALVKEIRSLKKKSEADA